MEEPALTHHPLFTDLLHKRGEAWKARGYELAQDDEGYTINGDLMQFYCDAVSRDADAHLALEFLREQNSPIWEEISDIAAGDLIDIEESQAIFLLGISLPKHIASLDVASACQ